MPPAGRMPNALSTGAVPVVSLSDLGMTYGGLSGKTKSDFGTGDARFITYKNIYENPSVNLDAAEMVRVDRGESQNALQLGDVLFTGSSETPEDVGMSSVVDRRPTELVYLNSFCFGYRLRDPGQFHPGFLKHLFRSLPLRRSIAKCASGVTRFNISKKRFLQVRIPVPPFDVQAALAEVLDGFTQLEVQLHAELHARQMQYIHYRDALLSFADLKQASKQASKQAVVLWKALGELGTLTRGRRFTNEDFVASGVGCIHYGEIYTHYGLSASVTKSFVTAERAKNLRMAQKGDLVIAGTGENVEDVCKAVAWLGDSKVAVHDDCYIFRHSLNPRYVAHYFQSGHFNAQKVKFAAGAKMIRVSGDNLGKIRIPVPSAVEQERIVSILDKFHDLVNSLSIGLPAELNARRKQYEYYRDRLLTFNEAA